MNFLTDKKTGKRRARFISRNMISFSREEQNETGRFIYTTHVHTYIHIYTVTMIRLPSFTARFWILSRYPSYVIRYTFHSAKKQYMYQFGSGDGWRVIVVINNVSVCEKKIHLWINVRRSSPRYLFCIDRSKKGGKKKRTRHSIYNLIYTIYHQ